MYHVRRILSHCSNKPSNGPYDRHHPERLLISPRNVSITALTHRYHRGYMAEQHSVRRVTRVREVGHSGFLHPLCIINIYVHLYTFKKFNKNSSVCQGEIKKTNSVSLYNNDLKLNSRCEFCCIVMFVQLLPMYIQYSISQK